MSEPKFRGGHSDGMLVPVQFCVRPFSGATITVPVTDPLRRSSGCTITAPVMEYYRRGRDGDWHITLSIKKAPRP